MLKMIVPMLSILVLSGAATAHADETQRIPDVSLTSVHTGTSGHGILGFLPGNKDRDRVVVKVQGAGPNVQEFVRKTTSDAAVMGAKKVTSETYRPLVEFGDRKVGTVTVEFQRVPTRDPGTNTTPNPNTANFQRNVAMRLGAEPMRVAPTATPAAPTNVGPKK